MDNKDGVFILSEQTIAFNQEQQKFAFCGDSQVYLFDIEDGAYTVESVIPFYKSVEDVADESKPEHDERGRGRG